MGTATTTAPATTAATTTATTAISATSTTPAATATTADVHAGHLWTACYCYPTHDHEHGQRVWRDASARTDTTSWYTWDELLQCPFPNGWTSARYASPDAERKWWIDAEFESRDVALVHAEKPG